MKNLFTIGLLMFVAACAGPNMSVRHAQVRTLQNSGYKVCSSDLDCAVGTYCGFASVDSVPVCRNGMSDSVELQSSK